MIQIAATLVPESGINLLIGIGLVAAACLSRRRRRAG
jgi:hypothetical protein